MRETGLTIYSKEFQGERGNYKWPVRFDLIDGFVGITQFDGKEVKDRVLLSPKQMRELLTFIRKSK
jgi:hypothetical protein